MRTKMLLPMGALIAVLLGCASHQQTATSTPSSSETSDSSPSSLGVRRVKSRDGSFDGEIIGTPAPNSKFAKLQIGMGRRQVEDLIGRPDGFEFHSTGKDLIPFYLDFGGDAFRWEAHYKNEGQLTFSGARAGDTVNVLIRIEVDPNATGYAR